MPAPRDEDARDIEAPSTIPIQPRPLRTRVVHLRIAGAVVTGIMRHWKSGDSGPMGRCKLCPTCLAYDDGCLTVVGEHVLKESSPLFSGRGLDWQTPGVAGGRYAGLARLVHLDAPRRSQETLESISIGAKEGNGLTQAVEFDLERPDRTDGPRLLTFENS